MKPVNPHHVYGIFDSKDRLLYIGCTGNPETRERQLRGGKFAGHGVIRFEIIATFHRDKAAAFRYESELIRSLRPPHNEAGNPDRRPLAARVRSMA